LLTGDVYRETGTGSGGDCGEKKLSLIAKGRGWIAIPWKGPGKI